MIENNIRRGAGDQHVSANIKLEAIQQQRVHHISDEKITLLLATSIPWLLVKPPPRRRKALGTRLMGRGKNLGKRQPQHHESA